MFQYSSDADVWPDIALGRESFYIVASYSEDVGQFEQPNRERKNEQDNQHDGNSLSRNQQVCLCNCRTVSWRSHGMSITRL